MDDRPILITGAAGFIGSTLTQILLSRGEQVVGIDNFNDYYRPERKRANIASVGDPPGLTFYEADICDGARMHQIVSDHAPKAIAHLAAYGGVRYSIGRAFLYTQVNIVGSVNMLEAARQKGVDQFVFASTSSVYGHSSQVPFVESDRCDRPLAPYPATKLAVEVIGHSYHHLHRMNVTVLRFFSVYGPRGRPDMMPFLVTDRIVRGETIQLFDGGQMRRDWTYVEDVVAGVITALGRPLGYEVINLGRGEPVLMADFVRLIEQQVGRTAKLDMVDAPPSEPKVTFANIEKAQSLLDYQPMTAVADGLGQLWRWYRDTIQP